MTSQQQLVCDNSTVANFLQRAQAVSNWFRSAGYTNTADSGQVNWSTIAAVPGANSYVYEVFQSNDAYTQFFVKVEYGNAGSTNSPNLRFTLATATDGAGGMVGFATAVLVIQQSSYTPPSATTPYECNFHYGPSSRIAAMMWRNAPTSNNAQQLFAIERSLDSNGNPTNEHVTLWLLGLGGNVSRGATQVSLVFGLGAVPDMSNGFSNNSFGWLASAPYYVNSTGNVGTTSFANSIPMDLCRPCTGKFGYPCTVVGIVPGFDLVEGVTFGATVYGALATYMPSKNGFFFNPLNVGSGLNLGIIMRCD